MRVNLRFALSLICLTINWFVVVNACYSLCICMCIVCFIVIVIIIC